jgi:hypothetical protein
MTMRAPLALTLLLCSGMLWGQKLDDSLLNQAQDRTPRAWSLGDQEAGEWNVWMELDAGTIEQFEYGSDNHIRRAATLGHAEWSDSELTAAMNRMGSSGFNNAVDYQSRYLPAALRIGASRQVWNGISAGLQLGRAWTPAYVNCTRADGESVVASWNQVRFGDFVDQYLYYDDLYNGDQWRYQNFGEFTEGITGWRVEVVLQQELAHGFGWTASLGTTMGLDRDIQSRSSAFFGSQGLLPEDELGATLAPTSVAKAPTSASLGGTYRVGPVVLGLSWSSVFVSGSKVNDWVAAGADVIDPINQMRLRLGMTF